MSDESEDSMSDSMLRITAPHFCAAVRLAADRDCVVETAPILKYMMGWPVHEIAAHCQRKRWTLDLG